MNKLLFILCFGFASFAFSETASNHNSDTIPPAPKSVIESLKLVSEENYFPIIKPGSWTGLPGRAVYQNFIGSDEEPELVIAFAIDTPDQYIFLMHSDKPKINFDKAVSNAYKNLESIDMDFQLVGSGNQQAEAISTSFSSEAILSQKHMRALHEILDAETLLVSVPTRGVLRAIALDAPDEVFVDFAETHIATWNEYNNARITLDMFVIKDGEIIDLLPVGGN